MLTTLNSVCTLDSVCRNRLILEVMPNRMRRDELQFYYIGAINKDIHYVTFQEFDEQLRENLGQNQVLYITFCGISRENGNVPEYYYLTLRRCVALINCLSYLQYWYWKYYSF